VFIAVSAALRVATMLGEFDFEELRRFTSMRAKVFVATASIVQVLFAIAFLSWLHAAHTRARFEVDDARFKPWFSVVMWFLPLANLVLPPMAMRELWRLSRGGRNWRACKPPTTIVVWWGAWLLGWGIPIAIAIALLGNWPSTVAHLQGSFDDLALLSSSLQITALVLVLRLVRDITAMQRERLGVD
jgi:hypothetical protein